MLRPTTIALTLLATVALPGSPRAADRRPRVAVMDLRSLGAEANTAELLSEIALTEATSISGVEAIGRSEINAVLGLEKQKQMFGCAEDGSCLAEIAGALGVDYVIVGSVGRIGQLYRLDMKLLDAKKARARDRIGETIQADQEKLLPAVQRAIRKLLLPIAAEAQTTADARSRAAAARVPPPVVAETSATPADRQDPEPPPPSSPSGGAGWDRTRWGYVAGGAGVALLAAGALVTGKALQETKYLREFRFVDYAMCPPDCYREKVGDSEDAWSSRMRISDLANGLGWTAVGTGLWLGLSGDRPAPGEPRRFLALSQRTWGYVLAGAGLAAGGVGLVFDGKADAARDDAKKIATYNPISNMYPSPATGYARSWAAVEYERLRNRYYLTGGALLVAGGALWLTGGAGGVQTAVDVVPTPGGAMAFLSGSW